MISTRGRQKDQENEMGCKKGSDGDRSETRRVGELEFRATSGFMMITEGTPENIVRIRQKSVIYIANFTSWRLQGSLRSPRTPSLSPEKPL